MTSLIQRTNECMDSITVALVLTLDLPSAWTRPGGQWPVYGQSVSSSAPAHSVSQLQRKWDLNSGHWGTEQFHRPLGSCCKSGVVFWKPTYTIIFCRKWIIKHKLSVTITFSRCATIHALFWLFNKPILLREKKQTRGIYGICSMEVTYKPCRILTTYSSGWD